MNVGDVRVWHRTFTEEDVRMFARFSGDEGTHHFEPDAEGTFDGAWTIDGHDADKDWW